MAKKFEKRVTASGEEHGLIKTLANSVPAHNFEKFSAEMKTKLEKQKKHENSVVKARYINHRGMHERLTKPYMRWAGDPIQMWHLIPGEVYDLPMGFVEEVNAAKLAKRSEVLDANGMPTKKEGQAITIHELVPISFETSAA